MGFLNLFLHSHCPLCQKPASAGEFCLYCARQLHNCHNPNPTALWQEPISVFGWGIYGGPLKRAIAMMKYENQRQIARPLGQWLGEAWLSNFSGYQSQPLVVPIPLHSSKQKQRGYNQAALIAKSFCQITGLKLKLNVLVRARATEAQFGLSISERENNLAEAFAVNPELHSRLKVPVLLIDDIYTTGATAKSAIQTLHNCRINVLGLAAVATAVKDNKD